MITISLPNCLPADGVAIQCDTIFAVNGFCNTVYNTCSRCQTETTRPYFFLACCNNCGFTALSEKCGNKIYLLNRDFEEMQAVSPSISSGPLLSAFCCQDCNSLLLTYRKRCVKSNLDGRILETVGEINDDRIDLLSVFPLDNGYLLAYTDNNDTIIRVIENEEISFTLPSRLRFKSFVSDCNGTVYILIGKGYPYTYLVPIYQNGMVLPVML